MGTLIWFVLGLVAVVVGVVLLYFRRKTLQKRAVMAAVETSAARDIASKHPGELVEVKGTLRCENPLTSELAQQVCAYFSAKVLREYESDNDRDGRSTRHSEVIAQNTRFAPFSIEDETGTVAVNAEGADVDGQQVMNKYESRGGLAGASISLGGITVDTGHYRRTLGYRYQEHILVPDTATYVLGVVQSDGSIGAPAEDVKDQKFIISYRSEEAFSKALGRKALFMVIGAVIAFVVAVGCLGMAALFRSIGM